jgi:hypothetical protein
MLDWVGGDGEGKAVLLGTLPGTNTGGTVAEMAYTRLSDLLCHIT